MVALLFFLLNLLASPFRSTCRRSSAMDLFVVPTIGFNLLYVLVISSCWARRICAGPCESMLATTILRERTGHWTRMRRSLARFSKSDASCRTPWLAGCITNTSGSRFSARTAAAAWLCRNAAGLLETLHPDHHHAGADSIAFGRLAPRGTGLHLFNHPGTQVDGIGLRHRSLQKTNQCRQTRSLTKHRESFRFEPSEICSR
jgi:hypothetical protein